MILRYHQLSVMPHEDNRNHAKARTESESVSEAECPQRGKKTYRSLDARNEQKSDRDERLRKKGTCSYRKERICVGTKDLQLKIAYKTKPVQKKPGFWTYISVFACCKPSAQGFRQRKCCPAPFGQVVSPDGKNPWLLLEQASEIHPYKTVNVCTEGTFFCTKQ